MASARDARARLLSLWGRDPTDADELAVECWCGEEIVLVLRTWVRKGLTHSCGRDGCRQST